MPEVVCILGMHRSGTSCLAGLLEEARLHLGETRGASPHNQKGYRENERIQRLHDKILADNGGSWHEPPAEIRWGKRHRAERDRIIEEFGDRRWGFKDPRALLTLHGWLEALPDMRFVGTFRHPAEVVLSLRRRDGFMPEKSMALWARYNSALLQLQRGLGLPLISFSASAEDYIASIRRLLPILGLREPEGGLNFFDAHLRYCKRDSALPLEVTGMYVTLKGLAL